MGFADVKSNGKLPVLAESVGNMLIVVGVPSCFWN